MLLALSIVSEHGAALGATAYKVFDERGGSIGRVAGNDWVLPDPQNFVSSKHARVIVSGGVFRLEDTSSNGTYINEPDRPVTRPEPQLLNDGDRLFIGDYEIIVQLIPSAAGAVAQERPAAVQAPSAPPPPALDPLAALGVSAISAAAPVATDSELAVHQAAMHASVRAAFNAMLAKIHPETLEESFERKLKRTAMLGLGNKAKYWEMYRAQFEEIDRDRDAHFQLLFDEEFARAYDEQLLKLTSEARQRKSR